MSRRRLVRVAPSFFDRLDELLASERTASGLPSATDFLLHELPPLIDTLAERYEDATVVVPDAPGVRLLVATGFLVSRIAIYTLESNDGAVDVVYLEIERSP